MTVYLDSVFLLNTAMDYLLCLLTARLAGVPLRRRRYLLAAVLGGTYAAVVFLPACTSLSHPVVKIAIALLMTLIAYRGEGKPLRLTLLFFLVSCVIAGAVLGLGTILRGQQGTLPALTYPDLKIPLCTAAVAGIGLVLKLVFQPSIQNGIHGKILPVRVSIAGQICSVNALWDTGNQLRDPAKNQPVLVISPAKVQSLLPKEFQKQLEKDAAVSPTELLESLHPCATVLKPCLLPYRTVDSSSGMLLGIQSDWVEVAGVRHPKTAVALAPFLLGNGYDALWGGDLKRGGTHEISG